jgi:hypothetical protein
MHRGNDSAAAVLSLVLPYQVSQGAAVSKRPSRPFRGHESERLKHRYASSRYSRSFLLRPREVQPPQTYPSVPFLATRGERHQKLSQREINKLRVVRNNVCHS